MYGSTGCQEKAEPLYRQAMEIWLKAMGPNHPNTKTVQANYDALRRKLELNHDGD
ncbi:MAG: tetratricopeptide repeat protein [Thermoguttaceae bacterium]